MLAAKLSTAARRASNNQPDVVDKELREYIDRSGYAGGLRTEMVEQTEARGVRHRPRYSLFASQLDQVNVNELLARPAEQDT